MKRSIAFLVLVILLAGGAIGAMSGPAAAQGYYPPPGQPVAMSPWVGNNTPWTFYKGDWFMNGILYYFFGPRYGFAPYYAYSNVYIVRPENWYAPGWNSWYQGHPQYWNNFERQYPYWRGHEIGHHYDENFYNRYHRGQGEGWNQGFHGVRPQGATGPGYRGPGAAGQGYGGPGTTGQGYRGPGTTGPQYSPSGTAGPGYHPQGTTGQGYRGPGTTGPQYSPSGTAGPGYHPQGATGPGYRGPATTAPGYHPSGTAGSAGYHPSGTAGPGGHPAAVTSPKAPAPSGGTPGKTPPPPPHEEKHQP